jgi:hypothetical protein
MVIQNSSEFEGRVHFTRDSVKEGGRAVIASAFVQQWPSVQLSAEVSGAAEVRQDNHRCVGVSLAHVLEQVFECVISE